MLPDFNGLRKQSCDRVSQRSLKPALHKGFKTLKSSQQIDKQRAATSLSEADHPFFALWTTCQSWSPILKKPSGWITIINGSGKKVPLVIGSVESHYRRGLIIGKRFGRLTNYLMVDVDRGSPFHPLKGGINPILGAMESLGLCRSLLIRSSESGGLHIYFPLAKPVSAYGLACASHAALTSAGVRIAGGVCELFPNKKAFNAEHNGHRLPLQAGSFLLDEDFRCTGADKAAFLQQWQHCAAGQDEALLAEVLTERPLPIPKRMSLSSLPPIAWTGPGQSNEVMKELVNYGDRVLGLNTIPALGDWMVAVVPELPGFNHFASAESKNDLTRKNWAYRWAKSHFKSARRYAAKTSFDHNGMVAAEALERLKVALKKVVIVGKFGIKKLFKALSDTSKTLFGMGFSWGLFQKHRKLILRTVEKLSTAGVSRSVEEDKNSVEAKTVKPQHSETEKEAEKRPRELLTARCVTVINDKGLKPSRTLAEQGEMIEAEGRPEGAELASVTEAPSGSAVEDVIKATAAQLRQVLGKACPFVGPGLWTVRQEEISAKAWDELSHLTAMN